MRQQFAFTVLATSLLLACGGGNDSSTPATPTTPATPAPAATISPGSAMGDLTSGIFAISNPTPITEIQPSPASIGANVPATYFGTAPSTVQKELIGPFQLLKSGALDQEAGTITLPLYKGQLASGETV